FVNRLNSHRPGASNISQKGFAKRLTTNDERPTTVLGSKLAADWGKPYNGGTPCLHIQTI
ncbi:MAG: hypothetical protein WBZ14_05765, partial [Terriglobales bacterium]